MTLNSATGAPILSPETVQQLVIQPLVDSAVATQVSTVVQTGSASTRFPIVTADPVTDWTAEGQEIDITDASVEELDVVPRKLAGLTVVSNELLADSDPSAVAIVGDGLVRDLQTRLDAAFFGSTTVNGPNGLESLTGVSDEYPSTLEDLDWAVDAVAAAELVGARLSAIVTHPVTLRTILKARTGTDFNSTLLASDPASPTKRSVYGVPLHASPHVPEGRIWGIDRRKSFVVIRSGASVVTDSSAFFSSDRTAVRCTLRVGFAFPHTAAIVKIGIGGS